MPLTPSNHDELALQASHILKKEGVVLYPTDTLYGLAVDATNESALEKLRLIKDRDINKPFSFIISDLETMQHMAKVTPLAQRLGEAYLPGALTLVLDTIAPLPTNISKDDTIALRIPDHPFCLALARALGKPYTATSANISGQETKHTVTEILAQFGEKAELIDLVIDAGELSSRSPSTIVDARGETPRILRQGSLTIV